MYRPHFPTINLSLLLLGLHFFLALSAARTFELPVFVQLFVDRYLCDQVLFLWEALLNVYSFTSKLSPSHLPRWFFP
jgi:hypothetical protein